MVTDNHHIHGASPSTTRTVAVLAGPSLARSNIIRPCDFNLYDFILNGPSHVEVRHLADEATLQWIMG